MATLSRTELLLGAELGRAKNDLDAACIGTPLAACST
jgi:hypothetical protein